MWVSGGEAGRVIGEAVGEWLVMARHSLSSAQYWNAAATVSLVCAGLLKIVQQVAHVCDALW